MYSITVLYTLLPKEARRIPRFATIGLQCSYIAESTTAAEATHRQAQLLSSDVSAR